LKQIEHIEHISWNRAIHFLWCENICEFCENSKMVKRSRAMDFETFASTIPVVLLSQFLPIYDVLQLANTSKQCQLSFFVYYARKVHWPLQDLTVLRDSTLRHIRKIELDSDQDFDTVINLPHPPNIKKAKVGNIDKLSEAVRCFLAQCSQLQTLKVEESVRLRDWYLLDLNFPCLKTLLINDDSVTIERDLPSNLHTLVFTSGSFRHPIAQFPRNLVYLELGEFEQIITPGMLPTTLEYLRLGNPEHDYEHKMQPGVLPSSLVSLALYTPQSFLTPGVIPASLEKLRLVSCGKRKTLQKHALGNTLLTLHYYSGSDVYLDNLPESLTTLRVQVNKESKIIAGQGFPRKLQRIVVSGKLDKTPTLGLFPNTLQDLEFFNCNVKLFPGVLPVDLQNLVLCWTFIQSVPRTNIIPKNLNSFACNIRSLPSDLEMFKAFAQELLENGTLRPDVLLFVYDGISETRVKQCDF
jgi:hypothetical protein